VSTTARFCEQCGAPLSSEGLATRPLEAHRMGQWVRVGDYRVRVHTLLDDMVTYDASAEPLTERSICLEVEYRNESTKPIKYRPNQWYLYDTKGYRYEYGNYNHLYQGHEERKLQGGWISPQRHVRGWVAFAVATQATIEYIQFLTGHLQGMVADIVVGEA